MLTSATLPQSRADELAALLGKYGFGPYFGTPCGVLAPLYQAIHSRSGVMTIPREDNAVGVGAGAALTGRSPVVLMQNSGFGQSVNAVASLVVPYRIPLLLIISMRGVAPDDTTENEGMGAVTEPICHLLRLPTEQLGAGDHVIGLADRLADRVINRREPSVLLVAPDAFGWQS